MARHREEPRHKLAVVTWNMLGLPTLYKPGHKQWESDEEHPARTFFPNRCPLQLKYVSALMRSADVAAATVVSGGRFRRDRRRPRRRRCGSWLL